MEKYIKAPNLWDEATQNAVIMGVIKLKAGQRVWCGGERTAIFVGVSSAGVIWVVHWDNGYNWDKFRKMRETLKSMPAYQVKKYKRDMGAA